MQAKYVQQLVLLLAALAMGALLHAWVTGDDSSAPPSEVRAPGSAMEVPSDAVPAATGDPLNQPTAPPPFHWSQLESSDFRTYIANLRNIGCPEATIRDLLRAELDQLYEPRHRKLEEGVGEEMRQEYWKLRRGPGPADEYARHLRHRRLDRDKEDLLAELLGYPTNGDGPGDPIVADSNTTSGDPTQLSRETREQVHEIQERYNHLQEQIYHDGLGEIYPDDAVALKELQEQRREELSRVLTPDQLHEFELRESSTSEHLRHELIAFEPTEDEFRTLFELRQSYQDEFGEHHFAITDEDYRQRHESAEEQMNEEIRAVLGDERFAEYKQSTDHRYRDLYRLGERFEVPEEGVNKMYDLWRYTEQQIDQFHGNESLSHEERMQFLAELREQVEQQGRDYLGEEALFNYRVRGGEWMVHLFE